MPNHDELFAALRTEFQRLIVLDAGPDVARLDDFLEWLGERPDVALAAVSRRGNEGYIVDL